jgi:hypothetical protein
MEQAAQGMTKADRGVWKTIWEASKPHKVSKQTTDTSVYYHMKLKPGFKVYQPKYHRMEASVLKRVNSVVANMKAAEAERQATEFLLSLLATPVTEPTSTGTTLNLNKPRLQGQDVKLQKSKMALSQLLLRLRIGSAQHYGRRRMQHD